MCEEEDDVYYKGKGKNHKGTLWWMWSQVLTDITIIEYYKNIIRYRSYRILTNDGKKSL